MNNTRLAISLLVAGALAFACGPRSRTEGPVALMTAQPLHVSSGNSAGRQHDSAVSTSSTPSAHSPRSASNKRNARSADDAPAIDSRFKVDVAPKAVRFALTVTNVGDRHVELAFPNGQSYEFTVVDSVGREVWRWGTNRLFTQSVQDKQLGAGDVMQVSEAWKEPKAGHYTAIATLESSNYPVVQRVDFVVR